MNRMLECISFKSLTLTPPPSSSITTLPPPPHSQGNSSGATHQPHPHPMPTPIRISIALFKRLRMTNCTISILTDNQIMKVTPLTIAKSWLSTFTCLLTNYFDHSESTCDLCLLLHISVRRTRHIYSTLYDLIAVLPDDSGSLSKHHCDRAYDIFVEFDQRDNPFFFQYAPHNFANIRRSFSELKQQIESRRSKSHSRIRLICRATNGCFFTTQAVAGCAAVAAAPFCSNRCIPHPKKSERKELVRLKQLDAAAKSTYVVNDLETIDSLVDRLQTAVEGDKALVRFGLKRGRERHPIQEVLKQLRKNQPSFQHQLEDLEEHIFLFFNTINKARSSLLQEICLHRIL
ncbi:hypothetical protein Lalb_Chr03g0039431 [Lupinus albus]|uniref:Uncharacterized protein n=1 Tax=Lupinus albus TaxID=3870 RepID=A0A6A4QW65_LUPAL|nr:hypothetical protein Lalb_Chr03g0039431 [Lupinus albus]